jgi:cytochrome c-type biogenesis protein
MELLQSFLENYNIPILSAFILGLMTAISPCPLATNITATAYISKNISNKRKVLLSGLLYALGRGFSYTTIGLILYLGASKFHVARFFNQNGEKFLGPLLILIGLIMLNIIKLNFFGKSSFQERLSEKFKDKGLLGSFLIGAVFSFATATKFV